MQLDPKSTLVLNRLDWFHACCPDAKFRDGKKAIEYGKRLAKSDSTQWYHHSTLSTAFAEAVDFDSAVTEQTNAIEMLKAEKDYDKDELKKAEARLTLY